MPIVFLFSAMVSGIAAVMLLYIVATRLRQQPIDMRCVDTIAQYLFYTFVIDFTLEMLDLIHRHLRGGRILPQPRFHGAHAALDIAGGRPDHARDACADRAAGPDAGARATCRRRWPPGRLGPPRDAGLAARRLSLYATAGTLTLIGVFAMRWNVVIGGQLFSKSFLGYTTYKMAFATREGLLPALLLMLLPFGILAALVHVLPPWTEPQEAVARPGPTV